MPATSTITVDGSPRMPGRLWGRMARSHQFLAGGLLLALITFACLATLPMTLDPHSGLYYNQQIFPEIRRAPDFSDVRNWFGTDTLGRSILGRCLLGGAVSLGIGVGAALISVLLGTAVGLVAGYRGGWIDSLLMRSVDVLFGLPYILLVILLRVAFQDRLAHSRWLDHSTIAANLIILFCGIGLVSWLTMARVVRGQVLSLRAQLFVEAARASGLPVWRIFLFHMLPNLAGPIVVYATLTIPQAILQESFLSFLGVGIAAPMPTWGSMAADGLLPALNPAHARWWMLAFPCTLLAIALLSLNFLGDGLLDVIDPKRETAKL